MDEMCRKMAERMSLGDFTNEQGKEGAKEPGICRFDPKNKKK